MMPETIADRLAAYSCSLRFEDLPEAVVHEAKRRFIDSLGTAVGAMDADAYAIAKRCAVRHVERAAPRFGKARSRSGNNDRVNH